MTNLSWLASVSKRSKITVNTLGLLIVLSVAPPLAAQVERNFPNKDSGVRADTPNDPDFDCNESDDPDTSATPGAANPRCASVFSSQKTLFGFAPSSTPTVRYLAVPADAARQGITTGDGQISGASIDRAWKVTTGRSDVKIAVLDTGIRWNRSSLFGKIFLNRNELPLPQNSTVYDKNGDGAFNVYDYEGDSRVPIDQNPNVDELHSILDVQDLIRAFSNGVDNDQNGYIDDISGWDFFENDNDPEDLSSYSAADGHGSGRAEEAVGNTNDGDREAGVCPKCQLVVLREWDTFVVPGDNYAAAIIYAAEIGVDAAVVANGVLQNTKSAQAATKYAHESGVALMIVSSDLNTANHNVPTNYVESVFINGCIADTETAVSTEFGGGGFSGSLPDSAITTWFRESNLTQHGAHAHVCFNAVTGSQATGHAGGSAGLITAAGLDAVDAGTLTSPLSTDEIKQLLTQTAEDVLPENTNPNGSEDPANPGWDEYFGYGRANIGLAVEDVAVGRIPPVVQITKPAWWQMLDPGETAEGRTVTIEGRISAARSTSCNFSVLWAKGVSPLDSDMQVFNGQENLNCSTGVTGTIGAIPLDLIAAEFDGSRTGGQTAADFNQYVFTVRIVATDADGVIGDDRKTYFVYHDPSWHEGWPLFVDSGGESSPTLYDIDGNGTLEIIEANSSGELHVRQHDGTPLPSFNSGQHWQLPPTHFYHAGSNAFTSGAVPPITSGFRTPAIADIDDDLEPEIIAAAGDGRIYILEADGTVKRELGLNLSLSAPITRNSINHPKRGILGAPVIADLDKTDGQLDLILAALDGHIYVWNPLTGAPRSGFPKMLTDGTVNLKARGELIATPAVADLNGDGVLEIISSSSDVYTASQEPPGQDDIPSNIGDLGANLIANTAGATSRVYALDINGDFVSGWPVELPGILPDVLPFIGPQHGVAVADFNGDGNDEVIASVTSGDVHLIQPDGTAAVLNAQGNVNGNSAANGKMLNLFEYYAVGDMDGALGLDIATGGVSQGYLTDLVVSGQNTPFSHVVQVWDSSNTEAYATGFPRATDDLMLLSTPIIGDVNATGTGDTREIIIGNGLYLMHAYGTLGTEAAGFPKLTGGWNFSVPALGDVDGDGLLELVGGTREGYRFVWDLTGQATADAIGQWPTESHDACNSNNYKFDCAPPSAVTNLALNSAGDMVEFTAPGDDWAVGRADHYELRTADVAITTTTVFSNATELDDIAASVDAGALQSFALPADGDFLAIVAVDDFGNRSPLRSVRLRTPPVPITPTGVVAAQFAGTVDVAAGGTTSAGSFTVQNNSAEPQTISAVQLGLLAQAGDLEFVDALLLSAPQNSIIEVSPANSSNTITLQNSITLAGGERANFSVSLRAKPQQADAATLHWFGAAYASNGTTLNSISIAALLLLALMMAAPKLGRRRSSLVAALILLTAGCGGSGSSSPKIADTPNEPRSTVAVTLNSITGNSNNAAVSYSGLPATLSMVRETE